MATIEINGKKIEAQPGQMIIEVADEAGIAIPRFCYHKKLSVAANCRMCLVEVEKSAKVLPACATPVTDGMKVFTQSPKAIYAQKVVMEFLLINHPLDCPICDQGGECELQDVSMGYGEGISRYSQGKRVVADEDLGSLIATDMTRCIHCTRCVRFGEEIAGIREIGLTGRGENSRIGTYVEHSMKSEISGNIIDLCPVGALTSKPYRFTARAWELQQYDSIAPHDCLGSAIHIHVRRGQVMRVVPKENEAINETWLSDRDRYSYLGIEQQRLAKPLIKNNGQWQEVDWQTALTHLVTRLKKVLQNHGSHQLAALASPSSTVEELYLLQKLMRSLGCDNIDHRLQQSDFGDQDHAPLYPGLDFSYAELEQQQALLLLGSHLQHEQPLAAVRVRKAALAGAQVMVVNPIDYSFNFDVATKHIAPMSNLPAFLAELVVAAVGDQSLPDEAQTLLSGVVASEQAQQMAALLHDNEQSVIVLGALAHNHPQAATLRTLVQLLAHLTQSKTAMMTTGANSAGAWLAGAVPHRQAAGQIVDRPGLTIQKALQEKLKAFILLGLEAEYDCDNPALALSTLQQAECVCVMSPYRSRAMLDYADIILPIATFAETSGTYVNAQGTWQSFQGCVKPYAEARPAWKVLRVLGNLLALKGFDYNDSLMIRDELQQHIEQSPFVAPSAYYPPELPKNDTALSRITEWPMYAVDSLVRRAQALQEAASAETLGIYLNSTVAGRYNLRNGKTAVVIQSGNEVTLPVFIDERMADNSVYVATGCEQTVCLGEAFGSIDLK